MSDADTTITVELSAPEARCLHHMACLWASIFKDERLAADPPDGCLVLPLDSACLKLELAMALEGVEL